MENTVATHRKWMLDNLGRQDAYNYEGTQTEEIAILYAGFMMKSNKIPDKTGYFISNVDHLIHNVNEVKCNIIDRGTYKEVSIIDDNGQEIDVCVLYDSLIDLQKNIKSK